MIRLSLPLLLFALIGGMPVAWAETPASPVRAEMGKVLQTFKQLQPYINDSEAFMADENQQKVLGLIAELSREFHAVESFGQRYRSAAGFDARVEVLQSTLQDAEVSYREGYPQYSLLRLKTVSNHCVGCHQAYSVKVNLHESPESLADYPLYSQGEYFLVSRQFDKAKDAYFAAAEHPKSIVQRMDALMKWLLVQTRHSPDPAAARARLQQFRSKTELNSYDQVVLEEWMESLEAWSKEGQQATDTLEQAAQLLQGTRSVDDPLDEVGTVELLRASGLLHEALDQTKEPAKRRKALYMLGVAYSKMPSIFVNELPEVYFEQCIREFPGSKEAKQSYRYYYDLATSPYIFGNESEIPKEVTEQLTALRSLAFQ